MEIDARGLACPEPVVRVQRGIQKSPEGLCVIVDHRAAVENITRFAYAMQYSVSITNRADGSILMELQKN